MSLRKVLVLSLCIGLQSSLCTGGVISVTAAVSEHFAYMQTDEAPMSYASVGYLSCKSSKRSESSVTSHHIGGGCENADTCFSQANSLLQDRSVSSILTAADASVATHHSSIPDTTRGYASFVIARAGPLYEDAHTQHHILLKTE